MEEYVEIIRDQDCDALLELELTPADGNKRDQCSAAFEGSLVPALEEAPEVEIDLLGGSGDWSFYGVRAGTRYFVVPILIDSSDGDDIDVVSYFRAEVRPGP